MTVIIVLALIGFAISLYTYFVEKKIQEQPDYKPVCDINDRISCTKPMKSPYANLLFVSNALVGMAYYAVVALLALLGANTLLFIAAVAAAAGSMYLAYVLYFKIKTLCLLCTALYVVNFLILVLAIVSR